MNEELLNLSDESLDVLEGLFRSAYIAGQKQAAERFGMPSSSLEKPHRNAPEITRTFLRMGIEKAKRVSGTHRPVRDEEEI